MKILAIETSCDETAICLLEVVEKSGVSQFTILGNSLLSQVDAHQEYGGVYPNLAKREHAKNLTRLLEEVLREAGMFKTTETNQLTKEKVNELKKLLHREPELFSRIMLFFATHKRPLIDTIAVTHGPGLEPALWVGINFAKALSSVWEIPVVAVNHMEGHIFASVMKRVYDSTLELPNIKFPAVALLISGGHTELVRIDDWGSYKVIGETRDDAVGEAFDKVGRMLGLPYPGGPEISRLAEAAREQNLVFEKELPRPMIDSDDLDFSFSGLKTSVLYLLKKMGTPDEKTKMELARAFEDAVADVLLAKTSRALSETGAKTLIIGGGVSANKHLRETFRKHIDTVYSDVALFIPEPSLATDNAIMIATAGYFRAKQKTPLPSTETIAAEGQLSL